MVKRWENIERADFLGVGEYDIPTIEPVEFSGNTKFIPFNYAASCKKREDKSIHFFVDDYQFTRLWNDPDRYMPMLREYQYVLTPDFSVYTDFPKVLQIYNHYRKHWIGAYMQMHGINVIPTIAWSTPDSYEWCFDGEPTHGTVAISSVGTQKDKIAKELFLKGYKEMIRRLEPESIIFYGNVPEECKGNIIRVKAFQEKFSEAKCDGW